MLLKCPKWTSEDFGASTLTELKIAIFTDIITLKEWKDIFWAQTFHFFPKFLNLSVSHQYSRFYAKKASFLQNFEKFCGKQTNSNFFLENRQSECFCLTKIFFGNIRPIEKKLCHFSHHNRTGGGDKCSLIF